MLDKLKFNNLVISNKKGIQQSRIQTINKLVHKIRKLKTLLEKRPDNTKCKERIRKSTETMEILKKLKTMDVMKQVLLMNKPAGVITNGIASPEEIAAALLSLNKVMQGLIKKFKVELQLNEAENDEWKQVLVESSKRKLKIERTEEKRRKRLELKQQKTMGRKRKEWLEKNQQNIHENSSFETDLNVSTVGGWQIEELLNDRNTNEIKDEIENRSNKEPELPIKEKSITNKTSLSNKKQKVPNRKEFRNFKNKEVEDERRNEFNTIREKSQTFDSNQSECSNTLVENTAESLVVDPFFITDNGNNYLSTAVNKRDNIAQEKNNQEKRDLHMIKLNNYQPVDFRYRRHARRVENENHFAHKRQQGVGKLQSKGEQENKYKTKTNKFSVNNAYDNNLQMRPNSKYQKSTNRDEKNLHPSWAAKRKLKPLITEFQGKKITFENAVLNNSNKHKEKEIITKRSITPKINIPENSLHPSWAAKQKLKPSIIAFEGKRIIFDNNE